jgi:hypoxanthine-guanine phosphoribosyltransferase
VSFPPIQSVHIELGRRLSAYLPVEPMDTTVIAMMRGGIFFAQGIYFGLGCKFQLFDPKKDQYIRPQTKYVVVADSVINTGSTIKPILEPDTLIASCVINEKAVPLFQDQLYTVRVSKNFFVGSNIKKQEGGKGPDTTMRLFNII